MYDVSYLNKKRKKTDKNERGPNVPMTCTTSSSPRSYGTIEVITKPLLRLLSLPCQIFGSIVDHVNTIILYCIHFMLLIG